MKNLTIAFFVCVLAGCSASVEERDGGVGDGTEASDQVSPGPEYDDGLPLTQPCSPGVVEIKDEDGNSKFIKIPVLCDPRLDNGVRPPDFIEPQFSIEPVSR